jgi:NAD(P) transhydrogenase subunit alpha
VVKLGVPRETREGELRVALVPETVSRLKGQQVVVEGGAGEGAGFPDSAYSEAGATVVGDTQALYDAADLVLKIQPPTPSEAARLREGGALVSFVYPLSDLEAVRALQARRATVFAMELMPRISRAQSMDALSSQSTVAGYKAVLLAANAIPKLFPMLTTAAGTIAPAKVFVIGAGVAGLQAIATARRLGALAEGYDVRPAAKEQVESLGAKFVDLQVKAQDAETAGGYAKAQTEDFYRKQQELLGDHLKTVDVVITTALVPGKRAPVLVSEDAVRKMKRGSVIVDLAAEQGGNCACTEPGKTVVKHGVTILGLLNLPSMMAPQASYLYSKNLLSFLPAILKDGNLTTDTNDELVKGTMIMRNGEVLHAETKAALGTARS